MDPNINRAHLRHGGIMANYYCTAACRHCLYACSPSRTGGYISRETAREVCELLFSGGCTSVHIGGGEPFYNFDGLLALVETITNSGISLEYIETNAYWATDESKIEQYLRDLILVGADALCISLDPFHAEYIPVRRPLLLAQVCERVGMRYFLWQQKFLDVLSQLDASKIHNRKQLEQILSPTYIIDAATSYGMRYGGRALNIELEYMLRKPLNEILSSSPCRRLLSGDHFHVDLNADYIPPGCTGIKIPLSDAVNGFSIGKYPVIDALLHSGVAGLYNYTNPLGFTPDPEGYTSGCAMCISMRHWLAVNAPHTELDLEHYEASLTY